MMATPAGTYSLAPFHPPSGIATGQHGRVLGITCIGDPSSGKEDGLPTQFIAAPLLGNTVDSFGEIWLSNGCCSVSERDGLRYSQDENILYGVVELDESDFDAQDGLPLLKATESAYLRIFHLLDALGYPHLWRVWNYFSAINAEQGELERYRQFNIGRQNAFLAAGRLSADSIPAACALGTASGALTIAFMAGRLAPLPIENPRQTSAYHYPSEYGPRSPTFSRAVIARPPGQELLFISGTASIVGHRTVHPGDPLGQTRETVANLHAVLEEANRLTLAAPYTLADLRYRVYLRHREDFPGISALLEKETAPRAQVVYVQADICRADLLVEIEAMASQSVGQC
jgi:enamine deaminase RidA (YjgF/YER057c/UK114 family)